MSYKNTSSLIFSMLLALSLPAMSASGRSLRAYHAVEKYFSDDDRFCFAVIAKKVTVVDEGGTIREDAYVNQRNYDDEELRDPKNRIDAALLKNAKRDVCEGVFLERGEDGEYHRKQSFQLVNEIYPLSASVTNDGKYIVTYGDQDNDDYSDKTLVIYRSSGSIIRRISLTDLFENADVEQVVSGKYAVGEKNIDSENHLLILEAYPDTDGLITDSIPQRLELKIDIKTGLLTEPKRAIPQPITIEYRVESEADISVDTNGEWHPTPEQCIANYAAGSRVVKPRQTVLITSSELFTKVLKKQHPLFPANAKAVRAYGRVVVELLVAEDGNVQCARAVAGHPLLRTAALNAAHQWIFVPITKSGKRVPATGTIAFNFHIVAVYPDGTVEDISKPTQPATN